MSELTTSADIWFAVSRKREPSARLFLRKKLKMTQGWALLLNYARKRNIWESGREYCHTERRERRRAESKYPD